MPVTHSSGMSTIILLYCLCTCSPLPNHADTSATTLRRSCREPAEAGRGGRALSSRKQVCASSGIYPLFPLTPVCALYSCYYIMTCSSNCPVIAQSHLTRFHLKAVCVCVPLGIQRPRFPLNSVVMMSLLSVASEVPSSRLYVPALTRP